ncbi:MAG: phosphoribosyltransferase family protein [Bacteroidota bacterium]
MPRTILLTPHQVRQRIQRLAWQLYEDHSEEKSIIIVGILQSGNHVATEIAAALKKISGKDILHCTVRIDKHAQVAGNLELSEDISKLAGGCIVLVDDVLNSGKTLFYALRPFLSVDVKKIRTVVLVDRNHRRFPIAADYSGLSLATTLREHITVEAGPEGITAYLE